MRLHKKTLDELAEMICGGAGDERFRREHFRYRSSSYLTQFFAHCNLPYQHSGGTRKWWVKGILSELDEQPTRNPQLPSEGILTVIQELMDVSNFPDEVSLSVNGVAAPTERESALRDLNTSLQRDGLEGYFDGNNQCRVRKTGTAISSEHLRITGRVWTDVEYRKREEWNSFLEVCSEDEFLEKALAPLFRQLGFQRIAVAGHKDKALEYGKDLWMRLQLPTGHWVYFGLQAKKGKVDAAASSRNENVATLIRQATMMLADPIFDPDASRKVLPDHIYIAASGDITKAARKLLVEHLDQHQRRHLIFLDRADLLDLLVDSRLPTPRTCDDVPF